MLAVPMFYADDTRCSEVWQYFSGPIKTVRTIHHAVPATVDDYGRIWAIYNYSRAEDMYPSNERIVLCPIHNKFFSTCGCIITSGRNPELLTKQEQERICIENKNLYVRQDRHV